MVMPRKPTALKIVQGTARPDRVNPREPAPKIRKHAPTVPAHLSVDARVAWSRFAPQLHKAGVLTELDLPALEMLCEAYADWRRAQDLVVQVGETYTTKTAAGRVKMVRVRPEVRRAEEAWRRFRLMLQEFGMTPSARARVSAEPPDGDEGESDFDD